MTTLPRARLSLIAAALASLLTACVSSSDSSACTCAADEKFDGTQCVAAVDFVAPTCQADDVSVCGCDGAAYASTCAAHTAGVEVKNSGTCSAASSGGEGGSFGW